MQPIKSGRRPVDSSSPQLLVAPEAPRALDADWLRLVEARIGESWHRLRAAVSDPAAFIASDAIYIENDAIEWLRGIPADCLQAVVTDPPYGLIEYGSEHVAKLRNGRGGVWRMPPALDGVARRPVPRFTVLNADDREALADFFRAFGEAALPALAPGGHLIIASNPLLSTTTFHALQESGFEKRGEIIRLVQTLRGGDRPKGAEDEFAGVSVMPRSGWEPWGVFRKPIEGTVADNLRTWGTGGLRRLSESEPFRDVIACAPARGKEREIAPHPSLKPQRFLRQIVRAALPLGLGIVADPFAGSGSTLAAARATGSRSIGADRDPAYVAMGRRAVLPLAELP